MNDAARTALRAAAAKLAARNLHGRLSVRTGRNSGRDVTTVKVRLADDSSGAERRFAVATVYAALRDAAVLCTVVAV